MAAASGAAPPARAPRAKHPNVALIERLRREAWHDLRPGRTHQIFAFDQLVGIFLIENGAIAHPVNNFRFNDSPIQMLARCDGLAATAVPNRGEDGETRVPTLRTHEFNLASISEAI